MICHAVSSPGDLKGRLVYYGAGVLGKVYDRAHTLVIECIVLLHDKPGGTYLVMVSSALFPPTEVIPEWVWEKAYPHLGQMVRCRSFVSIRHSVTNVFKYVNLQQLVFGIEASMPYMTGRMNTEEEF